MRDFAIMTDSCCDLASAMAEELELSVLPLSLHLGGSVYRNWLDGRDIAFPDFYSRVRGGESATTAAVSVGDFQVEMRRILQSGRDILCVSFSSALSATFQSASIAAEDLREEFPEIAACVEKIAEHIEKTWSCTLSEEEKLYLILHVNRILAKEGL